MVNQFLMRSFTFFILGIFSISSLTCGSSGPAVIQIDKSLTFILLKRDIYIEITASPKNQCLSLMASLILPDAQNNKKYMIKKGFRSKTPVYRIPWEMLSCEGKLRAAKALFPRDSLSDKGWEHLVSYTGGHGETLWRISTWFAGSGNLAKQISQRNKLNPQKLGAGTKVIIPPDLLNPCFNSTVTYPVVVDDLTFHRNEIGEYAEYILRQGQTIYSLVLKYTPRVTAEEVLAASNQILKQSGLKDFRSIPTNTVLKIPSDIISPQYLPPNDPRRIQFETTDRESQLFKPQKKAKALDGITIILDSGHGGVDPGSIGKGGVKEDEYAYDVMCRVKLILEKETKARVFVTIKDEETGYTPRNDRILVSGLNKENILTNPPYLIENSSVALNLRWMLTNYLFEKQHDARSRDEKVVFTSFHADSLHVNAQGLMVYIPGADYYSGNLKKTDKIYLKRKEAKSGFNSINSNRRNRLQAEGFSNAFADQIKSSCKKHNINMHSNQPIRKFVIRNRRSWVPAILRYCRIPTRVLLELTNLQNPDDVQRFMDPDYRQSLAEMYVDALKNHFSE